MKFHVPTQAELDALTADCPECEICCAIGLCCPPERQYLALTAMFVKGGSTIADAARHAQIFVEAKISVQKA